MRPRGEGPGVITRDGCAVDLYRRMPYRGELELLAPYLPVGCSVLELGCGTGRLTHRLLDKGHDVTAVDNSEDMLRHVSDAAHKVCCDIEAKLCAAHGYGLAYVSEAGLNAFFTRRGPHLDPATAWRPSALRAQYTGVDQDGQWQSLRDMPFVRV